MLYFGPVSLNWIFFLTSNVHYLSTLEKETYAIKKREFGLLLVYSWLTTLLLSKIVRVHYAAMPFFSVLSYVWTRKHPDQIFAALGVFHFPATYLSLFNIAMAVLQKQSIIVPLFGVVAGHLWWFFETVLPVLTKVDIISFLCFRTARKNALTTQNK